MVYRRRRFRPYGRRRRFRRPRRLFRRRYRPIRRFRRRRFSARRSFRKVPRLTVYMPDVYRCALKHTEYGVYNFDAVTISTQFVWSLNDWYDPYFQIGGGFCSGFENLSALYSSWIVYGCKITIVCTLSSQGDMIIALAPFKYNQAHPSGGQWRDYLTELTPRGCIYKTIKAGNSGGSSSNYRTIRKYWSISRVEQRRFLEPELYAASGSAHPARIPYCCFVLTKAGETGIAATCKIFFRIKYYGKFYDVKTPVHDNPTGVSPQP